MKKKDPASTLAGSRTIGVKHTRLASPGANSGRNMHPYYSLKRIFPNCPIISQINNKLYI